MYVRNDASKMVIQFNSQQETEMSVKSDFQLRTSDFRPVCSRILGYWQRSG